MEITMEESIRIEREFRMEKRERMAFRQKCLKACIAECDAVRREYETLMAIAANILRRNDLYWETSAAYRDRQKAAASMAARQMANILIRYKKKCDSF